MFIHFAKNHAISSALLIVSSMTMNDSIESEFGHGDKHGRIRDRNFGYIRLRDLRQERLRAVLHQFRERKVTADFHRAHVKGGTGELLQKLLPS